MSFLRTWQSKFWLFIAVSILTYASGASAQDINSDPRFNDVWKKSQELRDQPAVDATPVEFTFLDVKYRVPRNYIVHMPGSLTPPTFRVTFPGFEPLTEKTRQCLTQPRAYWPPGCVQVEFWLEGNDPPVIDDEDNYRKILKWLPPPQTPKPGPGGLDLYQYGDGVHRRDIYLKRLRTHTLFIDCSYRDLNGKPAALCSNRRSPLPNGNSVSYWIDLNQIQNAEKIDDGIRALIDSFTIKGDKQ